MLVTSTGWLVRESDRIGLLPPDERVEFNNGKKVRVFVKKTDLDPWWLLTNRSPSQLRLEASLADLSINHYRTTGPHYQAAVAKHHAAHEALALSRKPAPAIVIEGEDVDLSVPGTRPGFIYFIRSGDYVKIGFATNVSSRLNGIATTSPTPPELLGSIPGMLRDEFELHRRFRDLRTHREWFRLEGVLAAYIKALPK